MERTNLVCLANDEELLAVLKGEINGDLDFEKFLTELRYALLAEFQRNPRGDNGIIRLSAAIARQCFNNEYIFEENEEESSIVERIEQSLTEGLNSSYELIVYGMYKPLNRFFSSHDLLPMIRNDALNKDIREALICLVEEPLKENELKLDIPSFGEISNEISLAVQAQYEESPYPRWIDIRQSKGKSLIERTKAKFQDVAFPETFNQGTFNILVAGSGTGQHPIVTAQENPDAKITAVDLSRSSLAYGKRMAEKYGVTNIEFLHGDILELPSLGRRFHQIESVGVIHHMEVQQRAWEVLRGLLLPGGLLYLGVYSRVARLLVTFMRQKIATMELDISVIGIKKFRAKLLNDPEYKSILKAIAVGDLFTLSMFRDLLFHAREYQYTLKEIEILIKECDLRFVTFYLRGGMKDKYRSLFPDDPKMVSFECWKKFERYYTGSLFMFSFLTQKKF